MSDFFDDFNKILKKDLVPIVLRYFNDPNTKITDNLNDFLNDPKISLKEILEKISKYKNKYNMQTKYEDVENINDIDISINEEYDDLLERLIVIEETMIQLEKILKEKN